MDEKGDLGGRPNDKIRLRPANEADVAAILAVTSAAYARYSGRLEPPSSVFRETGDAIMRYLESGGVIVAVSGEEIVGAVRYEPREDHVYLGRLAVLPAWQKRGIGRRLVAAVEEWTLLLGLDEVQLGVRPELHENRGLYLHLGYEEDGLVPFTSDPGRRYLRMKKQLRGR